MKYLNQSIVILIASTFVLGFTSCKKDKEDPTITITAPEQHSVHNWGEVVHMNATFSDDRGLKSYTIFVGDANGTHLHDFDFMMSGETKELTFGFHDHFTVPMSAPMMAWVYFTVTDAEEKTTEMKWMLHFEE